MKRLQASPIPGFDADDYCTKHIVLRCRDCAALIPGRFPGALDALQAAIESLDAVEVAPGYYAVPTCDPPQHVGSAAAIIAFANGDDSGMVPMPAWWKPDARFAWRMTSGHPNDRAKRYVSHLDAMRDAKQVFFGDDIAFDSYCDNNSVIERITADLATGKEVPA